MSHELEETKVPDILLVEDNPGDVFLTRKCFEKAGQLVHLHHVNNGVKCLRFLRKEGEYADVPSPVLIILDLNMPVMGGREVLEEMILDKNISHFPVIVLTTSTLEQDVSDMYRLRCSSYFQKPVDFDEFEKVIQSINHYWMSLAILPNNP